MKNNITLLYFLLFIGTSIAQQASGYFPAQTGFEWKFKAIPLDSVSEPINALTYYRMDKFESVADYEGKLANIVPTKSGSLQTILLQPYFDSLFYSTEGTTGYEYFSIRNIEGFLNSLDSLELTGNFSFLSFFTSLQDWYDNYRFASPVNTTYTLLQKDTTITISGVGNVPLEFKYSGKRLPDETTSTVLGNFDCKKFLLQWKVTAYSVVTLLTLNDTIWIAPDNWIVQDIVPGQYVDNLTFLGIPPFSIPGLDTRLTDDIVTVATEESTPNDFSLEQNYPNPFNPSTNIGFKIAEGGFVSLKVFDILGNEVATLVNEEKSVGTYELTWNASMLSSGVYFYQLKAGEFISTKKMILLK